MKIYVFGGHDGEAIVIEIEEWLCVIDAFEHDSRVPVVEFLDLVFPSRPIDLLVVTHPHTDHYSGIDTLFRARTVRMMMPYANEGVVFLQTAYNILNEAFQSNDIVQAALPQMNRAITRLHQTFADAKRQLRANYFPAQRHAPSGSVLRQKLKNGKFLEIKCRGPYPHLMSDPMQKLKLAAKQNSIRADILTGSNSSPNLYSTVLEICYDGRRHVFFADATNAMMQEFLNHDLGATALDFVKVAHHGSKEGGLRAFWDQVALQVKPCVAVTSNHKRHKLPTPSISKIIDAAVTQTGGTMVSVKQTTINNSYVVVEYPGSGASANVHHKVI